MQTDTCRKSSYAPVYVHLCASYIYIATVRMFMSNIAT